jgi:hypothetical protein
MGHPVQVHKSKFDNYRNLQKNADDVISGNRTKKLK